MSTDTQVEYVQGQHPDEWSIEEFGARIRNARRMTNDIQQMIDRQAHWYIPPEWRARLKDFVFIRLGTMANLSQQATILTKKFILEEQGWKQAPKGVVYMHTQSDRDQGVYMCIPRTKWAEWKELSLEIERIERRNFKARRHANIADHLENGPGPKIHIERFEPTQVTTTVGDLIGEQLDKAKRRK